MSAVPAATETVEKKRLSLAFRKAAKKDVEPLAKVFARAFGHHNEFGNATSYIDGARTNPDHRLIVAEAPDGTIAGFVMTDFNSFARKTVYIDQLAVDPDYQGFGIGRALMLQAEDLARAYEKKGVALHVRTDNDKAIALYKSMGYKQTGSVLWYYGDGTTGLEMVKKFNAPANDNSEGGWGAVKSFVKRTLGFN